MRKVLRYLAIVLVVGLLASFFDSIPVQAAAGTIIINSGYAATGTVGSTQTINGFGFTVGESVTIHYDGISTLATNPPLTALTATSWTATIIIPESPSGVGVVHSITAQGSSSGTEAQPIVFTIIPKITVSATSALIGTAITVSGTGYAVSETNIVTNFDGAVTAGTTQTANNIGSWSNSFNVPNIAPGAHTIHAAGSTGVDSTVSFSVTAPPRITVNPARGIVGSQVTVSGTGFAAGETGVSITLGNNPVGSAINASAGGAWAMQFNVPETHGGAYSIDASGDTTLAGAVPNITYTVTPSISISPQAGPAGTPVSISGTGFGANENNIAASYDGADQGSPVRADANGSWNSTFTVPVSSGGTHSVGAHGPSTPASTVPAVVYRIGSGISINKNSGPAGTSITVSGNGFAANETSIVVNFDGTQVGTTAANASGIWTANVVIPAAAGGDHTITAKGRTTTTASGATFTINATISTDKISGVTGTSVTVTGAGFAANETGISVTFDGVKVGQTITASASGDWTLIFPVPASSSGTHVIAVNGSVTQLVSSADLNFKISAELFLPSPATGFPGSQVIISGSGFAPKSTLQITFDDNPISNVGAITTSDSGNFSKTITIPVAQAGSHVIKVIDDQTNTGSRTFDIDGTPPAAPKLNSPADGTKSGFFGGITPTFKWAAVTDPRGDAYTKSITYSLQIDTSADFSNPIVDLTGLTKTVYTLSKAESLPGGQYYWHVQAVDAASNSSAWSPALTLTSGTMSPGTLILIILAVLVALTLIYFLVIRRIVAGRRRQPAPAAATEVVIPEIVNAEYRTFEIDDPTKKRALPWRLALPQAPAAAKGPKTLSAEDQARLKTVIDFARSLPLVETGSNTNWLVDLAENDSGTTASPTLYAQIINGEIQVKYEPAWMHHPSYLDLQTLLEGQPVLQDLDTYVDAVNHSAAEAVFLLQDIYRDVSAEVTLDIFAGGGWSYISAVYTDAFSWFRGKNLREPSERDYSIKGETEGAGVAASVSLNGEQNTPFPGRLILVPIEADVILLRTLHLKLRRNYRNNERAKELAGMIAQLEVQRNRLLNAFAQFNRLGT